jgi:hypothetical protein
VDFTWYKELNLKFDSRKNSTKTLQSLFNGENPDVANCSIAIKQGYEIIEKTLKQILSQKEFNEISIEDFCNYLFDNVVVLRVLVPEDTDLNRYFEIMNSRGEQLEKHEILKARMLEIIDEHDKYAFSLIWEACSNMERYVQYGFSIDQRNAIFGSDDKDGNKWNALSDMAKVYELLKPKIDNEQQKQQSAGISIADLLKSCQITETQKDEEDSSERFNTIVTFANFLMHILRIQIKEDIPLDDKRLIELFEPFLKEDTKGKEFVKEFGYNLLKGKFLLDKYVIKREFTKGTDRWSLKQLKWYEQDTVSYVNTFGKEESNDDINREILMILSMFHVSMPTLVYKHWLNAVLKYIFENSEEAEFSAKTYKEYLEELAKSFLYDRFLAKEPKDYFEIIYTNNGISNNTDIDETKLDHGTAVENFIFNYLDYLLWKDYKTDEKTYFKDKFDCYKETLINDKRIIEFEYTFRSSVEHYYPQQPIEGNIPIALKDDEIKQGKPDWLNNFGNLCLISSSKNSRLSNYMPKAKKEHYNKSPTIDSIKQRIMMEYTNWDIAGRNNVNEIEQHGNKMKKILIKNK